MRLLHCHTLEFAEFYAPDIPKYAILSHRWGRDEVSYKDFCKGRKRDGPGYKKILGFCEYVREAYIPAPSISPGQGGCVQWGWIDTCCIDKRSSAELSEAINSMFSWYESAELCVVYLADVASPYKEAPVTDAMLSAFGRSDWFSRGWTLQELLAPRAPVLFLNDAWEPIGHRCMGGRAGCHHHGRGRILNDRITAITGIQSEYLSRDASIGTASVARRMSWAARRSTTRIEDQAYALLGIFQINMPLLYGEGDRAFVRLQEEIIRRSHDQSIFGWLSDPSEGGLLPKSGILAGSPAHFARCSDIVPWPSDRLLTYAVTNRGLELSCRSDRLGTTLEDRYRHGLYAIRLNCGQENPEGVVPLELVLTPTYVLEWSYKRVLPTSTATTLISLLKGSAREKLPRRTFTVKLHRDA